MTDTYFQVLPDAISVPNLYVYTYGGQQMFEVYSYSAPPSPPLSGNQLLTTSLIVDMRGGAGGGNARSESGASRDRDSQGRRIRWD